MRVRDIQDRHGRRGIWYACQLPSGQWAVRYMLGKPIACASKRAALAEAEKRNLIMESER